MNGVETKRTSLHSSYAILNNIRLPTFLVFAMMTLAAFGSLSLLGVVDKARTVHIGKVMNNSNDGKEKKFNEEERGKTTLDQGADAAFSPIARTRPAICKPLRLLVVSGVHDSKESAARLNDVYRMHSNYVTNTNPPKECMFTNGSNETRKFKQDILHFALLLLEEDDTAYQKYAWYHDDSSRVIIREKSIQQGCKPDLFKLITLDIASQYDYLWLKDDDLSLYSRRFDKTALSDAYHSHGISWRSEATDFDWHTMRSVLLALRPTPFAPFGRTSSDTRRGHGHRIL